MNYIFRFLLIFTFSLKVFGQEEYRWDFTSINNIGGNTTTILGSPLLVTNHSSSHIVFDGVNDGLQLGNNPLKGAQEFTIEVIINPYAGGNFEQRFLHLEQDDNNRILIELRLQNTNWWLDTFIKSGSSSRTLIDATNTHPSDRWYHLALTYKKDTMTHYVNGIQELSGQVIYTPVTSGKTSIGVRLNKVSWYKGAIKTVKITHSALAPKDFITEEIDNLNSPLSVDKSAIKQDIVVSPNPVSSTSFLRIHSLEAKEAEFELYDAFGRRINIEITNVESGIFQLHKNDIKGGVYFLIVKEGSKKITKQLLISN